MSETPGNEQVDPKAAEELTGSASVLSDGETPEDVGEDAES